MCPAIDRVAVGHVLRPRAPPGGDVFVRVEKVHPIGDNRPADLSGRVCILHCLGVAKPFVCKLIVAHGRGVNIAMDACPPLWFVVEIVDSHPAMGSISEFTD